MHTDEFWKGEFGDEYVERNNVRWQDRVPFWQHIAEVTQAKSFLDVGTSCGWNLLALRSINPEFMMSGVDVNLKALQKAQADGFDVHECPADAVVEKFGHGAADLVVTSGVLIHVAPDALPRTMAALHDVSSRYVLAIEYADEVETEVKYRQNDEKLWRRPFGKLYAERGLKLVETGAAIGFDRCQYWLMTKE